MNMRTTKQKKQKKKKQEAKIRKQNHLSYEAVRAATRWQQHDVVSPELLTAGWTSTARGGVALNSLTLKIDVSFLFFLRRCPGEVHAEDKSFNCLLGGGEALARDAHRLSDGSGAEDSELNGKIFMTMPAATSSCAI